MITGRCLIDPKRHTLQNLCTYITTCYGGCEELPVRFGIQVSAIEWEPVLLADGMIPITGHLVDVFGNKAFFVTMTWLKRFLSITKVARGWGGRGGVLEMKAEKGVGKEIIYCCPGAVPIVREFGVCAITGDGKVFPFRDVDLGNVLMPC